jgi:hypothetical protein
MTLNCLLTSKNQIQVFSLFSSYFFRFFLLLPVHFFLFLLLLFSSTLSFTYVALFLRFLALTPPHLEDPFYQLDDIDKQFLINHNLIASSVAHRSVSIRLFLLLHSFVSSIRFLSFHFPSVRTVR